MIGKSYYSAVNSDLDLLDDDVVVVEEDIPEDVKEIYYVYYSLASKGRLSWK
jgi:hypothetical protein